MIFRTAINAVTDEWETFVQSILGRDWDNLWSILRQEELQRFTKKQHSPALSKVKTEEEEDAALALKKQSKKKKDLSKIKCFQCGEWVILPAIVQKRRRTRKHLLPNQQWQCYEQHKCRILRGSCSTVVLVAVAESWVAVQNGSSSVELSGKRNYTDSPRSSTTLG